MFRKWTFLSFLVFAAVCGVCVFRFACLRSGHQESYRIICEQERSTRKEEQPSPHQREGVVSDYLWQGKEGAQNVHLASDSSVVIPSTEGVQEVFQRLRGWIKIDTTAGDNRCYHFSGDQAFVEYSAKQLTAEGVFFQEKRGEDLLFAGQTEEMRFWEEEEEMHAEAFRFVGMSYQKNQPVMTITTPYLLFRGDRLSAHEETETREPVFLLLGDNDDILCGNVEWDLATSYGILQGQPFHSPVVFRHRGGLFTVEGASSAVQMEPYAFDGTKDDSVAWLTIDGDVHIQHGLYHIFADRGRYEKGIVSVWGEEKKCVLHDEWGSSIQAEEMAFFRETQRIVLQEAQGKWVYTPSREFDIRAQQLSWDISNRQLAGRGPLWVEKGPWGDLYAENELVITFANGGEEREVESVSIVGNHELSLCREGQKEASRLSCKGSLHIDHRERKASLQGDAVFVDGLGKMQADSVEILYRQEEGELAVQEIRLKDDVAIVNHYFDLSRLGKGVQYILADEVVYWPEKKEMHVSAHPPHRALFYNAGNQMEMSAEGFVVTRDPIAGAEAIRGIGNVAFSLEDSELQSLKKRFRLPSRHHFSMKRGNS